MDKTIQGRSWRIFTLTLTVFMLYGCIGQVPTPRVARSGDLVSISLGGIKRNLGGQILISEDLTVTLTDANSVVHEPRVKGTYRVFPDHTSMYAVTVQDRTHPQFGQLTPHDGAVWVTLQLTDVDRVPLQLALGPATISISSPKLTQTSMTYDGDYNSIPIEIVAGVYLPSLEDQQNLAYETEGYLTLKPSGPLPGVVGGAQIEVVFDCALTEDNNFQLRAVPLHHNPNVNLIQSATSLEDCSGTGTLTVALTNPNGFAPSLAVWQQGQGTEMDLQLAIVSTAGQVASIADIDLSSHYTVSGRYVDLNGDTIPGLTPVLANEIF